jgi:hypothetical protein
MSTSDSDTPTSRTFDLSGDPTTCVPPLSAHPSFPKQVQVYLYLLATTTKDSLTTLDDDAIPTALMNVGLKMLRDARAENPTAYR